MATVKELLTVARGELGNTENPAGSNRSKYGLWYGWNGVPWCMIFIMWCFAQVGVKLPKRTASCGDLMRAAQAAECWVTRDFRPGDVVIFDFPGGAATDHCGIVEMELPDYGVQSIEGNTSQSGSQSNGGMVCRKNRPGKYIVGAVRPKFDAEEDIMTGKEIYDALNDYLKKQSVPSWAREELAEAVKMGITDGKEPMGMVPRYQAAIMAKRVLEGK